MTPRWFLLTPCYEVLDKTLIPGRFARCLKVCNLRYRKNFFVVRWRNAQRGSETSWYRNVHRCETSRWRTGNVAKRPVTILERDRNSPSEMFAFCLFRKIDLLRLIWVICHATCHAHVVQVKTFEPGQSDITIKFSAKIWATTTDFNMCKWNCFSFPNIPRCDRVEDRTEIE